jgi:catechol 2,3-dioxygenase-like lactoylglutathione lyase family enzyme
MRLRTAALEAEMGTYPEKGAGRPVPMDYGAAIPAGLGVNLLVRDVDRAARFQAEVLGAEIDYWEEHFAILRAQGAVWFLHSDWSYCDHPMTGALTEARGAGAELRLYGCDPDAAEARARALGAPVLDGAADKPHGLREAYLIDPDGYVWVPCIPIRAK